MPKDYDPAVTPAHAQRRPELALDDTGVRAVLASAPIGHVATAWDGQPFLNPTTFWYDAAAHRVVFHSNVVGRLRANAEHDARACFSASTFGRLLPSNVALEFSIQYESVVVFGDLVVLADPAEKRAALTGLISKYFPTMQPGQEYRPITEAELKRTSVYALTVRQWSGKRNWPDRADQSDAWPALAEHWFA